MSKNIMSLILRSHMKVIRIAFVHISYMHASEFFYEKYHNLEKKAVYKLVT